MTRVLLWRHGQTDWNSQNRFQGHADAALNDVGRAQAAVAAPHLAALGPDAIVASDLSRAADTAAALAAVTGLPVHHDARLRERSFGEWQGKTADEIAAEFPVANARWRRGETSLGYGVEEIADLTKRVAAAVVDAVARAEGGTVVIVTHGGSAKYVLGELLGWPPEILRKVVSLANCHWSDLRNDAERGWLLRGHNISSSLPA